MFLESLFQSEVTHLVTSCIVVEQAVEADALDAGNETAGRSEGLQAAAGADAYHRQRAVLVTLFSCGIVNVSQCVKLVDHDVDVVASDAM